MHQPDSADRGPETPILDAWRDLYWQRLCTLIDLQPALRQGAPAFLLNPEEWRNLEAQYPRFGLWTYDDLIDGVMRQLYE